MNKNAENNHDYSQSGVRVYRYIINIKALRFGAEWGRMGGEALCPP